MTVSVEVPEALSVVGQQAPITPELRSSGQASKIGLAAGALAIQTESLGTPTNYEPVGMAQRSSRQHRREPKRPKIIVGVPAAANNRPLQHDGGMPPGGNHNGGYGAGGFYDENSGGEEYPSVSFNRRRPTDRVERPGESFYRYEIDRTYLEAELHFLMLGNNPDKPEEARPHYELTPLHTVAEILNANGRASIADVGCGTGLMLYMLGCAAASRANRTLRSVNMTGFSRYDYSKESQHSEVINAMQGRNPLINYVVGDAAQTLCGVGDASQDVTLAYNLLIHIKDPTALTTILEQMLRITRRSLFFTCDFDQTANDLPIGKFINNLESNGYPVLGATGTIKAPEIKHQSRIVLPTRLGVQRPCISVCRVDIPQ